MTDSEGGCLQISNIISQTDLMFIKYKPDALLVLGDTNSCLCVISAKRRKIPIFHMEAGNRCFDLNVPEEINRKIIPKSHHETYVIKDGDRVEIITAIGGG